MSAEVDERIPEEKNAMAREDVVEDQASSGMECGIKRPTLQRYGGALSTLLLMIAIPLLAVGYQYYQDWQLQQRHVSCPSLLWRLHVTLTLDYHLCTGTCVKRQNVIT